MRSRMRVTTASSWRPPSIAVVEVRTRVTEPRTCDGMGCGRWNVGAKSLEAPGGGGVASGAGK
jgi:hypothetical protein